MIKKFISLWFTILALSPSHLIAKVPEKIFSANNITIDQNNNLMANGNVKVELANFFVNAESVSINTKTKKMEFKEIYRFYDGGSVKFQSKSAKFDENFADGIIAAAQILIDDSVKIHAEEVKFKNGHIESVKGVSRVSSCEECKDKQLKWNLTASSAKRDVENSNIVYKNVAIRIKGLPVAYIPYLRLPDPSVDRARGFLVPEAILTSNLESGLKLPILYHWA